MTGAPGRGLRFAGRAGAVVAAVGALLLMGSCGKKAPLRLPDQRPAEGAPAPRASIREGRLTLEFTVPSHRLFPEREDPWVLARILRRQSPATDFLEVGAILEGGGFAFGAPLTWSEAAQTAGTSAYRVEFRDGARRRRAVSEPVEVTWQTPPAPPAGLVAVGDDRAVALSWGAPPGATAGIRYRVYRRDVSGAAMELVTPLPLEGPQYTDVKVQVSHEYCYQVRTVLGAQAMEVASVPSAEVCAKTEDVTPPPPPGGLRLTATPGGFQLVWEAVAARDLLGYRVYRAIDNGPLELVTSQPVQGTAFREETRGVAPGARFRYVVTAVDASARRNESPFSAAVEAVALPADEP